MVILILKNLISMKLRHIDAIEKVLNGENSTYPNTLEDDYKILQTLYKLEEISEGRHDLSRWVLSNSRWCSYL